MARSNNATDTQNWKMPNIRRRLRAGNDFAIRAPSSAGKTIGTSIAASGSGWMQPGDPGNGGHGAYAPRQARQRRRRREHAEHRGGANGACIDAPIAVSVGRRCRPVPIPLLRPDPPGHAGGPGPKRSAGRGWRNRQSRLPPSGRRRRSQTPISARRTRLAAAVTVASAIAAARRSVTSMSTVPCASCARADERQVGSTAAVEVATARRMA